MPFALLANDTRDLYSSVASFPWGWLERKKLSAPQNNSAISKQKQTTALRRDWERVFWVNLKLCTYVKKAYVRIVKMHPKIDRPHPMYVIIDSGSSCSSLGWRKSKYSLVKQKFIWQQILVPSNYYEASVRRRRNLTTLGLVVRKPISAQPGIKFNPGFFFLYSKGFSRIIFSVIFRASNHQLVDKKN